MELLAELRRETRHGPDPDHPRPRRGGRRRRPDRGDVRRADRRAAPTSTSSTRSPAHPYTEGLLESIPRLDQKGQELYADQAGCRRTCADPGGLPVPPALPASPGRLRREDVPPLHEVGRGREQRLPLWRRSLDGCHGEPILRSATWSSTSRSPRASCFKKQVGAVKAVDGVSFDLHRGRDARHRRRVRLWQVHRWPSC